MNFKDKLIALSPDKLAVEVEVGQKLYDLVKEYQPQQILEVGTGHGVSTAWMMIGIAENTKGMLYTLDREFLKPFAMEVIGFTDYRVVRSVQPLKEFLPSANTSFDMVFMDSDHQIDAIVNDIELIEPYLMDLGIVCVHDTQHCPEMGLCLSDYFNGVDSDRLKTVGVKPSTKKWIYEELKSECGLGIARGGAK